MTSETHSQLAGFIWSICNYFAGLTNEMNIAKSFCL
jgi:hypothetical protein